MQTISSEESFSNPSSSKTGNGNDYSITLEYPLKKIPDSIKNNIHISFKAYQKSINNEAKLIIQAEGDNFNSFWHGTKLNTQITKTNKWITYNQTFVIPDSIKQANNIKIYVYNPSANIIFIDDLSVKFKD